MDDHCFCIYFMCVCICVHNYIYTHMLTILLYMCVHTIIYICTCNKHTHMCLPNSASPAPQSRMPPFNHSHSAQFKGKVTPSFNKAIFFYFESFPLAFHGKVYFLIFYIKKILNGLISCKL